jgi:hypothetical protein
MADITDRQQEVLDLLRAGMKARAVGEELGISRNAVYQQIQALKKKGLLDATYTPSGEVRTQPAHGGTVPTGLEAGTLMRVIESQQQTIAQQADTCARLAAKLSDVEKTQ